MATMTDRILRRLEHRILTLTLNKPEALNPVDFWILAELADLLRAAAADDQVGVVVLTGAGRAFCAGGDMAVMDNLPATPKPEPGAMLRDARKACDATVLLHEIPKPTIAMISGPAAGGGLVLAAACDMRVADDTAKFSYAYPKIGLGGDIGAGYFLGRLLGPAKAAEFCLLSPVIGAAEALALGLVNRVVAADALAATTHDIATKLAAAAPLALAAIKENLRVAETAPIDAALDREAENLIAAFKSADHKAAVRAFIEKRKPVFTGR